MSVILVSNLAEIQASCQGLRGRVDYEAQAVRSIMASLDSEVGELDLF